MATHVVLKLLWRHWRSKEVLEVLEHIWARGRAQKRQQWGGAPGTMMGAEVRVRVRKDAPSFEGANVRGCGCVLN